MKAKAMKTKALRTKALRTKTLTLAISAFVLVALSAGADAAPNIPSSELPGRARQQFQESPIDRFTQPPQKTAPLWQWECDRPKAKGRKSPRRDNGRC
ncbi:MAG TPA: hypothetical protein VFB68_12805 [Xanthobacteraceae bacterium]|nr:hypothetical protein [Xanthobacteraceae bacterium]